jgi:hypothetical protein
MMYVGQLPGQRVITLSAANDAGPSSIELAAANISAAQRKAYQQQGVSLPDGSFPIPTIGFLRKAIMSIGRTPPSKRPEVIAHIKTRAEALKASNLDWIKNFVRAHSDGGSRDATKKAPAKTYGMKAA